MEKVGNEINEARIHMGLPMWSVKETYIVGTKLEFICKDCFYKEGYKMNLDSLIENFKGFISKVNDIVSEVEKLNPDLKGLDKHKIAKDASLTIYDSIKADLKLDNGMLDFVVINLVIPFLIDNAVKQFNLEGVFTHKQ